MISGLKLIIKGKLACMKMSSILIPESKRLNLPVSYRIFGRRYFPLFGGVRCMEVSINGGSTCTVSLFGLSETVEHYQLRNLLER